MSSSKNLIKRLDWVEIRTGDYQHLKKFFSHTLGLSVNFEEERKDFIQHKIGTSKTYLAILDTKKTGMSTTTGYIPTLEVADLDQFIKTMKKKGVRFRNRILEGEHVRLTDFYDPDGNTLQAFEFKHEKD